MRRLLSVISLAIVAVAVALAAAAPQPASAATLKLRAVIDRAQAASTCPGAGPGNGFGDVTYDTVTNMLSWEIAFTGMSGAPSAAHFHGPAGPGSDAGIQVTIGDLTSPSIGSATITETQEGQLLSGLWYINYHTSMCGGGEIRGQVLQSVGGVAELPDVASTPLQLPDGSSGVSAALIAGITAAAIATAGVTGAGLWYARRRVRS